MEKLGLIIKITDDGDEEHSSINKEPKWAKHASDARSYIDYLEGFDGTSKTTTFVKFIGASGYLTCLVKANPQNSGRANDNTAAWIYIPSNIDITGETISQIIDSVENIISDPNKINTDKLKEIFNNTYPIKDLQGAPLRQLSSKDEGKIAVRLYGENTDYKLSDLLGNDIAQIDYNGYKALFLIDNISGITPIANKSKTITAPIRKICTIFPPQRNDKGFIPNVKANEGTVVFSKPIEVSEGATFNIIWKRKGYKDVVKPYIAIFDDNNNHPSGIDLVAEDYYLLIDKSSFRITDNKNRRVDKCSISINGKPLITKETSLPEYWFADKIDIEVKQSGYETYSKQHDNLLKEMNPYITIKLEHVMYNYVLKTAAYNNEDKRLDEQAIITIKTKEKLTTSPLKGYITDRRFFNKGGNNFESYLKYDEKKDENIKKKYFLHGLITSFLACLIIGLSIIIWKEKNNYEMQFAWPPIVKVGLIKDSLDIGVEYAKSLDTVAIKYLDGNTEWEKDSLDKYYNGLYNDMIKFNFVNIKDKWNNELSKSSNFQELVVVATAAMNYEWDLSEGSEKNFLINNSTINYKKYIEWINTNTKDKPAVQESPKDDSEAT